MTDAIEDIKKLTRLFYYSNTRYSEDSIKKIPLGKKYFVETKNPSDTYYSFSLKRDEVILSNGMTLEKFMSTTPTKLTDDDIFSYAEKLIGWFTFQYIKNNKKLKNLLLNTVRDTLVEEQRNILPFKKTAALLDYFERKNPFIGIKRKIIDYGLKAADREISDLYTLGPAWIWVKENPLLVATGVFVVSVGVSYGFIYIIVKSITDKDKKNADELTKQINKSIEETYISSNGCILFDSSDNTRKKIPLLTCDPRFISKNEEQLQTCTTSLCNDKQFNPCITDGFDLSLKSPKLVPSSCSKIVVQNTNEGNKLAKKYIACDTSNRQLCSQYCSSENFLSPSEQKTKYISCQNTDRNAITLQVVSLLTKKSPELILQDLFRDDKNIIVIIVILFLSIVSIILFVKYIRRE